MLDPPVPFCDPQRPVPEVAGQPEGPVLWHQRVGLPALLRFARVTFRGAVRQALADGGFEDLPANGPYVLGSIARNGSPLSEIVTELGLSKQAAGQLVDTLVRRGYLERAIDPEDRRRLNVSLTERGAQAAAASRSAVERIERELLTRAGAEAVAHARLVLATLGEIGQVQHADHDLDHDHGAAHDHDHGAASASRATWRRRSGSAGAALQAATARIAPRTGLDRLGQHLEERYGIEIAGTSELDLGVVRIQRRDGPDWVARIHPATRSVGAAAGDAAILRFLADGGFPAGERRATDDPVSQLEGQAVVVTEYVEGVPLRQRSEVIRDHGGLRRLGELLGELTTMAGPDGAPPRRGGAWHHLADGTPAEEIAAAIALLDDASMLAGDDEQEAYESLRSALAGLDDAGGLPEGLVHPDFVMSNVVPSAERGLVLVDWTGAGRAARLWPLSWFLFAEGAKDLRRVGRIVDGYCGVVALEDEELARLAGVMPARATVLACWSLCTGRTTLDDALGRVAEARQTAAAVSARVGEAVRRAR